VPISTVMGLSEFSLTVTQGIPRQVVSSWMPPESVTTIAACIIKQRTPDTPWLGRDDSMPTASRASPIALDLSLHSDGTSQIELLTSSLCSRTYRKDDRAIQGELFQPGQDAQKDISIIDVGRPMQGQ